MAVGRGQVPRSVSSGNEGVGGGGVGGGGASLTTAPGEQQILDAQGKLVQAQHMYNDIYKTIKSLPSSIQQSNLAMKVAAMKLELAEMKNMTEVHDREYVDLAQTGKKPTVLQLHGLSTVQDWVLFLFFTVYGLFVLGLLIAVGMSGQNVVMGLFSVTLGSLVFGIMISTIIMRYG